MTTEIEKFRAALNLIAQIPLWGESIVNPALRQEYIESFEYDARDDSFNPSSDTESNYLRDAVEVARRALGIIE